MKNKILNRQLKKLKLEEKLSPKSIAEWKAFLNLIQNTYAQFEEDRYLLERSLEISSKEMAERMEKNKELNLQLIQASKLSSLGTLSSGIAHELNNPLAALIGHLELITRSSNNNIKINDRVEKCLKLTSRMQSLINHLRRLSHSSKDEDFQKIDVLLPIVNTFDLLGKQLLYDDIQYEIETRQHSEIFIMGDENNLESIFQNLITNSLQAFSTNNFIKDKLIKFDVNMDSKNNLCIITYSDNAGGMTQETTEKIFDPFYTTKDVGIGTGLGMSITKKIIESHKGEIKVNSILGKGSEFIITVPLFNENNLQSVNSIAEAETKYISKIGKSNKRIIFIDDEQDICDIYGDILSEDFIVDVFCDPIQAQKAFENKNYDLLITDIKMPKVDGSKIVSTARKHQPNIKVIVISGHANNAIKDEFLKNPNLIFLDKPLPYSNEFIHLISMFLMNQNFETNDTIAS